MSELKLCPKCGKIVGYNSWFGKYCCTNCGEMFDDIGKTELKPCPFCGAEASFHEERYGWSVECRNDFCELLPQTISYRTKEDAAKVWNRRANNGFN